MLQNQGQDLVQTSRAYQSQFSLGMSSSVGRNFKMRRCQKSDECMVGEVGQRDGETETLIIGNRTVGEKVSQLQSKY